MKIMGDAPSPRLTHGRNKVTAHPQLVPKIRRYGVKISLPSLSSGLKLKNDLLFFSLKFKTYRKHIASLWEISAGEVPLGICLPFQNDNHTYNIKALCG
jgi:hypothetical protein